MYGTAVRFGPRRRLLRFLFVLPSVLGIAVAEGHEGHRPLPTRGVEVDATTGRLVLSRAALDALAVSTAEVSSGPLPEVLEAYATVVSPWNRHAAVGSQVAGRIVSLAVRPGESVRAGQRLAEIESPELERLRLEYQAALTTAELSIELAAALEPVGVSGAVSRMRLLEARSAVERDRSAVDVAAAKLLGLGISADELAEFRLPSLQDRPLRTALISPIDGVVLHADLAVGKTIAPQEHVFEILDLTALEIKIDLAERDLQRPVPGRRFEFRATAFPERRFTGTLLGVGPGLDPRTYLGAAWGTLDAPAEAASETLRPGLSGLVRIPLGEPVDRVSVPAAAILRNGAERFVLVEEERTDRAAVFRKRPVATGNRRGDRFEIFAGEVYPGDRVMVVGNHELAPLFVDGALRIGPVTAQDIGLRLEPVAVRPLADVLTLGAVADVPPTHRAVASTPLAGTVRRILVERNRSVRRGELLAEVESLEFRDLQLELLQAETELAFRKTLFESLAGSGDAVPERRRREVAGEVRQATTLRQSLRHRLRTVGLTDEAIDALVASRKPFAALTVRAPIDGTAAAFDKFIGEAVRPDEPLFEVHDPTTFRIRAFASEQDGGRLRGGQTARVSLPAFPDEVFAGRIVAAGPALGLADRTSEVWIELDPSHMGPLRHGLSAAATIELDPGRPALSVPRTALVSEGPRSYVFVRLSDGRFERRPVRTGRGDGARVELTAGAVAGEEVVVQGTAAVRTGYVAVR